MWILLSLTKKNRRFTDTCTLLMLCLGSTNKLCSNGRWFYYAVYACVPDTTTLGGNWFCGDICAARAQWINNYLLSK